MGVKYGERVASWTSQPVHPPYGCSLWKQLELDGIHSIYLWATGLWCG